MQYRPNLSYPDSEQPKLADLAMLYEEWHQHFTNNNSELAKLEDEADGMVFDGFYPHYFASNKRRVLFVGWETVDMWGRNYIEDLHCAYHSEPTRIRNRNLDSHKFTYRLLCIAYGIVNGMPPWKDIPDASVIADTVGEADGLSFAYMNISKMSNQSGSARANRSLIETAYALSTQGRNFIREQVTILDPEIIITMNLEDKIVDSIGDKCESLHPSDRAQSFRLKIGDHTRLLIDPNWHFSAWTGEGRRLDDDKDFYSPICDLIRRGEATL
jgi:hypothetical protein